MVDSSPKKKANAVSLMGWLLSWLLMLLVKFNSIFHNLFYIFINQPTSVETRKRLAALGASAYCMVLDYGFQDWSAQRIKSDTSE